MVAGVCQGLSHYTGLPVTLVRLFFILAAAVLGWGVLIYMALCLAPVEPRPAASGVPPGPAASGGTPRPATLGPLRTVSRAALSLGLALCVHLPVAIFLLCALVTVLMGIWYPLFTPDIFRLSLSDLGAPGLTLGIATCLSLLLCLVLLAHTAARLYFARSLLKGGAFGYVVSLLLCVATAGSALSVIFWQYRTVFCKTWSQPLVAQERYHWSDADAEMPLPVREITIKAEERANPKISYTVKARGQSRQAVALDAVVLVASDGSLLPRLQNAPARSLMAELAVEIVLPARVDLRLDTANPLPIKITGVLRHLSVRAETANLVIENAEIDRLDVDLRAGLVTLDRCRYRELNRQNGGDGKIAIENRPQN